MRPIDYIGIAAWGKHLGSFHYFIEDEQRCAAAEDAPADALAKRHDGSWLTLRDLPKEHAFHARYEHEQYVRALCTHDWFHAFSDDHRVWCAGEKSARMLQSMQQKLDPDHAIWNIYAPKEFKR